MGRPTKLTPECQQFIIQALSVGATHKLACQYAGITEACFYFWLEKGAKGQQPYLEFFDAVKKTEGRAAVSWLAKIEHAASEGTWQAAAWKLERRYPQDYGKTVQEHTGPNNGPIVLKVVYENLPTEDASA